MAKISNSLIDRLRLASGLSIATACSLVVGSAYCESGYNPEAVIVEQLSDKESGVKLEIGDSDKISDQQAIDYLNSIKPEPTQDDDVHDILENGRRLFDSCYACGRG